jgi:hypothetical protein
MSKIRQKAATKMQNRVAASSVQHPPQFSSTVQVSRTARFTAVGGGYPTLSITRADLLNHLLVCTLTTAHARILSGFKVNRIKMWTIGSAGVVVPTTCSVEWTSTYGPSRIISDTSMSVAPAHINSKPPPQSLASFWSLTGSNEGDVVMIISVPQGTVIDLDYTIILQNGETAVNVVTTTSDTLGALYMCCLDGAGSFGYLKPQSYVNTF